MEEMDNMYWNMSDEELIALYKEKIKLSEEMDVSQQAKKILLNSLYGASGSPYFMLYKTACAEATTTCGQLLIRSTEKKVSNFINTITENKSMDTSYCAAGDTDSTTGDALLRFMKNGKEYTTTIKEFYDETPNDFLKNTQTNWVKKVENASVLSINDMKPEYTNVKYVMKHIVKKKMYTLRIGKKKVTITQDHSLMCLRNNELIEIKPKELQKGDKIIYITE